MKPRTPWSSRISRVAVALALVALVSFPIAAGAVEADESTTASTVIPVDPGGTDVDGPEVAVAGVQAEASDPGGTTATLPLTGGDIAGIALIGAGIVVAGLILTRGARARTDRT